MKTTDSEVRLFKKKWYHAYTTGNDQEMSVGGRGRVVKVTPKSSPYVLGFSDDHADDINTFQGMVVKLRTCKIFHDMMWKYCDEYLLSMAESFVMIGVLKDFSIMVPMAIADVRLSQTSPVVLVRFAFDEEAYQKYFTDSMLAIHEQTSVDEALDDDNTVVIIGEENAAS